MSALKNLTRPGALAPSRPGGNDDGDDAAAIASRAILDAGMLPLLVGILLHKPGEGGEGGTPHDWQPNTLQDSALYTLLHMSALPGIRGALVTEEMNCAEVLSGICGACGRHEAGKGPGDLDQMRLQHLKAVSYFVVISFSFDSRKRRSNSPLLPPFLPPGTAALGPQLPPRLARHGRSPIVEPHHRPRSGIARGPPLGHPRRSCEGRAGGLLRRHVRG